MMRATIYNLATGQIVGQLTASLNASGATNALGQITGANNAETTYINVAATPPLAIPRPAMGVAANKTNIIANGTDAADFTEVPDGATVSVDGVQETGTVTDGTTTFTATVAGTYTIVFSCFPFLDDSFTIVATEP